MTSPREQMLQAIVRGCLGKLDPEAREVLMSLDPKTNAHLISLLDDVSKLAYEQGRKDEGASWMR